MLIAPLYGIYSTNIVGYPFFIQLVSDKYVENTGKAMEPALKLSEWVKIPIYYFMPSMGRMTMTYSTEEVWSVAYYILEYAAAWPLMQYQVSQVQIDMNNSTRIYAISMPNTPRFISIKSSFRERPTGIDAIGYATNQGAGNAYSLFNSPKQPLPWSYAGPEPTINKAVL